LNPQKTAGAGTPPIKRDEVRWLMVGKRKGEITSMGRKVKLEEGLI
jgi:hypothetical protein